MLGRLAKMSIGCRPQQLCSTLVPRPSPLATSCSQRSKSALQAKGPGGARSAGGPPQDAPRSPPSQPPARQPAPPVREVESEIADAEFGEGDEGEEFDPLAELPAAARRRVLALKDVQAKYDETNKKYQQELAALQAKYLNEYAPVFDERRDIVSGAASVSGTYDIPDDGAPDEGIPEFWLNAFANHPRVGNFISERDAAVLRDLKDVRLEILTSDERGFKLHFIFGENQWFKEETLVKTYILEPEDEIVPKAFLGTPITWKEGKDVTTEVIKKRVKAAKGSAKGDKAAAKAFTTETVPCDSFFNFFDPPEVPKDSENLTDEELQELQDELSSDFEIGYAIRDTIIPRAVEWFTGEIAPLDEGDYDEDYDEDEEEAPEAPPPRRR